MYVRMCVCVLCKRMKDWYACIQPVKRVQGIRFLNADGIRFSDTDYTVQRLIICDWTLCTFYNSLKCLPFITVSQELRKYRIKLNLLKVFIKTMNGKTQVTENTKREFKFNETNT